ncbi:MAG: hypothetical protein MUO52_17895 [Desulfobacterales bacterium]|nr:hypothetical protein [Desulfobacterales bacterium]
MNEDMDGGLESFDAARAPEGLIRPRQARSGAAITGLCCLQGLIRYK